MTARRSLAVGRPPTRPTVNPALVARLRQVEQCVKDQRYEAAANHLDVLLARYPTDPYANFRAGWLCALRGHYDVALNFLRRALHAARCPWSEALNAIGAILMRLGRYDEGLPYLHGALQSEPRNVEAWINLANWAEGIGDDTLALDILSRASQHPGNLGAPGIRWSRSFIELKRGDYRAGWTDYECRWLNTEWVAGRDRVFPQGSRFWYGAPLAPGTPLLVHFEQGQGDTVMMLRYLPWLRARTPAAVILQVQDALVSLVRPWTALYDTLHGQGETLPDYSYHVSLMSLPHIHDTRLETIPPPLGLAA
jgi:tetratricopeptide (TPR) repeat protein